MELGRKPKLGIDHSLPPEILQHQIHRLTEPLRRLEQRKGQGKTGQKVVEALTALRHRQGRQQRPVTPKGQCDPLERGQAPGNLHCNSPVQMQVQLNITLHGTPPFLSG